MRGVVGRFRSVARTSADGGKNSTETNNGQAADGSARVADRDYATGADVSDRESFADRVYAVFGGD